MEKVTGIVDYALPTIHAERALRMLHEYMLERKYDEAAEQALIAIAETKLAWHAIKHQQEQET